MSFDPQALINFLAGIVLMLVGGFVKVLWDAVKTLQKDLNTLEVNMHRDYVPKGEFREGLAEVKEMLTKISDKLDAKQDKR